MARMLLIAEAFADRQLRRERIFRDRQDPLETMRDDQLYQQFRFDRQSILFITDLIKDELNSTKRSKALLPHQQVLVALQYFASGTFQLVCGDILHVCKSTANDSIWRVTNALVKRRNRFIRVPNNGNEADKVKAAYYAVAKFPGVLGCVDGTHVRIQRPTENEYQYINRKWYPSINVQAVCLPDGRYSNVVAKWPGSSHDARILRQSQLFADFESGKYDGILLGDSGYPCLPWLMTPYRNPQTEAERKFNSSQRKTRVTVEQSFGRLKRRFHILHGEVRLQPGPTCRIITAACVLHNLAIERNQPDFFDVFHDDSEGMEIADYDGRNTGNLFRDHITSTYFS